MKRYQFKTIMRLPAALAEGRASADVAAGEVVEFSDDAAARAGRFLNNRVAVGDAVELPSE